MFTRYCLLNTSVILLTCLGNCHTELQLHIMSPTPPTLNVRKSSLNQRNRAPTSDSPIQFPLHPSNKNPPQHTRRKPLPLSQFPPKRWRASKKGKQNRDPRRAATLPGDQRLLIGQCPRLQGPGLPRGGFSRWWGGEGNFGCFSSSEGLRVGTGPLGLHWDWAGSGAVGQAGDRDRYRGGISRLICEVPAMGVQGEQGPLGKYVLCFWGSGMGRWRWVDEDARDTGFELVLLTRVQVFVADACRDLTPGMGV